MSLGLRVKDTPLLQRQYEYGLLVLEHVVRHTRVYKINLLAAKQPEGFHTINILAAKQPEGQFHIINMQPLCRIATNVQPLGPRVSKKANVTLWIIIKIGLCTVFRQRIVK